MKKNTEQSKVEAAGGRLNRVWLTLIPTILGLVQNLWVHVHNESVLYVICTRFDSKMAYTRNLYHCMCLNTTRQIIKLRLALAYCHFQSVCGDEIRSRLAFKQ